MIAGLYNRSLLFAKLSAIAYQDEISDNELNELGFKQKEFYNRDGAQAWRFENDTDIVIACRGTQPKQWNDIKADLRAIPVRAETISRVHKGFKIEVDDLWPMVLEDLKETQKTLWFCGHSLGAAMATIMSARCYCDERLPNPVQLYTYGSPRVGWGRYVKDFETTHVRWVNNNDIVARVPFAIIGYRHDGKEHYMNAYGKVRPMTGWQRTKDCWRGFWMGIKKGKIDNFSDHSMTEYIKNLENHIRETNGTIKPKLEI
jgi:triacylglycerol lipase